MQIRKAKGLCFNCDEKYSPQHKCPNKRLLLLSWDDQHNEESELPILLEPDNTEELERSLHSLSLNAMHSMASTGTMRFMGNLHGKQVHILLDGGSDESFIQPRLAHFLRLEVLPAPSFRVLIGNGQSLEVEGRVEHLHVTVQKHDLEFIAYLLPVKGAEIILGAAWLAMLGPHIADYSTRTIHFTHQSNLITLHGIHQYQPLHMSLHQLQRMQSTNAIAAYFTLTPIEDTGPSTMSHQQDTYTSPPTDIQLALPPSISSDIQHLLHQYKHIFTIPTELPPSRTCNHRIQLVPNTSPVKVRPYRYPHNHKSEIERMVKEMLQSGLIEHSTNPFSSPVLLVKKKDGTWRFCTDYRALNAITIKDAFPIPTVDELLDELHGAAYFPSWTFGPATTKSFCTPTTSTKLHSEHITSTSNGS